MNPFATDAQNPTSNEEMKQGSATAPLDLMDFISKSDVSTVGGQTGTQFNNQNNNAGGGQQPPSNAEAEFQQFLTS
jgi:hypothetical protein